MFFHMALFIRSYHKSFTISCVTWNLSERDVQELCNIYIYLYLYFMHNILIVPPSSSPCSPLPHKLSYDTPRFKLTPERATLLIKWFEEHKEHPYPSRHEKILLCQQTQLTFTQVGRKWRVFSLTCIQFILHLIL